VIQEGTAYYSGGVHLYAMASLGLELRWSWGGFMVSLGLTSFGTPNSAMPASADSDPLMALAFRGGFGLYF
jgi:hypothetical protein